MLEGEDQLSLVGGVSQSAEAGEEERHSAGVEVEESILKTEVFILEL